MSGSSVEPKKKPGCLRRLLGCLGLGAVLFVGLFILMGVLPGYQARSIRNGIKPGQTVEEVVSRAQGWLSAQAFAGPAQNRTQNFEVTPRGFRQRTSEEKSEFSSSDEMARALAARMASEPGGWTMSFGYITLIPKRIYFDVEFSQDGRVKRVSETRFGALN